ncbi:MAG: type 4a pilus biogenesis protein PilO [Phycisphaerae bacterium]|nr:type 4a pilus biogenesis protein PilO [Phycisphaerae bacterium]
MSDAAKTSWKRWHVDVAGLVVCGLISLGFYFVSFQPILKLKAERVSAQAELKRLHLEADQRTATLTRLRDHLAKIQQAVKTTAVQLQPVSHLNQRVSEVTALAAECGLKVDKIQPGNTRRSERFEMVPIQMAGIGSYASAARFLHRLHGTFRDTGLASFQLNASPEAAEGRTTFNLQLTWYAAPRLASARP